MEPIHCAKLPSLLIAQRGLELSQQLLNKAIPGEKRFIELARAIYPEIMMYHGEVRGSPDGANFTGSEGEQERLRTELSLKCLYWILQEDYVSLSFCQPYLLKLKPQTFVELCQRVRQFLTKPELVHAMLVTMAIHDIGKCVWFEGEVFKKTNHQTSDHDEVLYDALVHCPHLLPSYQQLPVEHQRLIKEAWETGLNTGQFIQGENLAFHLVKAIEKKRQNPLCLEFFFCHELLDMAGVMGHIEQRGSEMLTELTSLNFRRAWDVLSCGEERSVENVYERYLWKSAPLFSFNDPILNFAARRLICLARLDGYDLNNVETCAEVIKQQSRYLIEELNVTGLKGKKGILIKYAPNLLGNLLNQYAIGKALHYGLKLMEKVYRKARELEENTPGNGSITVNIRKLCEDVLVNTELVHGEVTIDPKTKMVNFA